MESTDSKAPFGLGQPTSSQISGAVIVLQSEIDELRKEMKKGLEGVTKKHKDEMDEMKKNHKDEMDEIKKNHKKKIENLRKARALTAKARRALNIVLINILEDKFGLEKGTVGKMALERMTRKKRR